MAKTREEALEDLRKQLVDPNCTVIRIPAILRKDMSTKEDMDKIFKEAFTTNLPTKQEGEDEATLKSPSPGSRLDETVALLKEIEFSAGANRLTCPSCREVKRHSPQCRLKHLLDAVRA
jgi:hypothetical protein